jgi:hypothetical protein
MLRPKTKGYVALDRNPVIHFGSFGQRPDKDKHWTLRAARTML